jgi:hypothetical protein
MQRPQARGSAFGLEWEASADTLRLCPSVGLTCQYPCTETGSVLASTLEPQDQGRASWTCPAGIVPVLVKLFFLLPV